MRTLCVVKCAIITKALQPLKFSQPNAWFAKAHRSAVCALGCFSASWIAGLQLWMPFHLLLEHRTILLHFSAYYSSVFQPCLMSDCYKGLSGIIFLISTYYYLVFIHSNACIACFPYYITFPYYQAPTCSPQPCWRLQHRFYHVLWTLCLWGGPGSDHPACLKTSLWFTTRLAGHSISHSVHAQAEPNRDLGAPGRTRAWRASHRECPAKVILPSRGK